jgi:hypothetical protein
MHEACVVGWHWKMKYTTSYLWYSLTITNILILSKPQGLVDKIHVILKASLWDNNLIAYYVVLWQAVQ